MLFSAASAPDPASTELRELRLSLNTPILAGEGLPVGPARAAITVVQGPAGEPRLEVAIHSLRTDQVLFFATETGGDAARVLDAALSFTGAMGFLFEEDEIDELGDVGCQDALRLWTDWVGKAAQPPRSEPQASGVREYEAAQPPCASEPQASGDRNHPILLSKFRRAARIAQHGDRKGPLLTGA